MDCSPPGSSVHGIFQARVLEWGAIAFSAIGLWHAMKSGFYMTTSDDQLGSWTEKKLQGTSQSQTCTKRSRSLFGGLLPILSTIAFWILAKSLHLRSMLSKLMKSTENCNDCSWHWSTERAQLYSTTMTNYVSHNQHCRSWTNLAMKFCLIHHIHLISRQPFLQMSFNNFLQESHLHNQQEAENAFQEFTESWSTNFYATWINKLTSCWQKCVDFNGSYFD